VWAAVEKQVRAVPGFKMREAWAAEIERKIAEATQKRQSALSA